MAGARIRVLVCGTNYGRRYLEVIAASDRYELAGILSRGSLDSTLVAAQYGVPLYSRIEDVPPPDVDAAVAAMGPSGDAAVLALLRRGVPVLYEHPVSSAFLEEALETARASGAAFHVNTHFAFLPAPRAFIERCRTGRPSFLDAMLTPRLLYAFLDILRHAMGPLPDVDLRSTPGTPFTIVTGTVAGITTTIQLERLTPDGSADNLVDCRLTAGFPDGILTMLSLSGPVVWNANYRREVETLTETVFAQEGVTKAGFQQQRLAAIERSLTALVERKPEATPEHLIDVSRAAEQVRAVL